MIRDEDLKDCDEQLERLVTFCGNAISDDKLQSQLGIRKLTGVLARFCCEDSQLVALRSGNIARIEVSEVQKKLFVKLQVLCNMKRSSLKLNPLFQIVQLSPRLMCVDEATFEACKSLWRQPSEKNMDIPDSTLLLGSSPSKSLKGKAKTVKKNKSEQVAPPESFASTEDAATDISGHSEKAVLCPSESKRKPKKKNQKSSQSTQSHLTAQTTTTPASPEKDTLQSVLSSFQLSTAGVEPVSSALCETSGDWQVVSNKKKGPHSGQHTSHLTEHKTDRRKASRGNQALKEDKVPTSPVRIPLTRTQAVTTTTGSDSSGHTHLAQLALPSSSQKSNESPSNEQYTIDAAGCALGSVTSPLPDCCRGAAEAMYRKCQREMDEMRLRHEAEMSDLREVHYQAAQTANLRLFIANNTLENERQERAKVIEQAISEYIMKAKVGQV